jgi:excinuclease UvrABC nuclease subunit
VGSYGGPVPVGRPAAAGPGVYRFHDQAGRALYVGRAISLRRRVLSYRADLGDRGHLAPMVARIARVEAVAHAADGQAGAEGDLARLRGAPPCARAELARAIAAVLRRDQDAVAALRAELTARRAAAAAALAFEFAGKLQAELEALDWITEEQKVTRAPWGQDDADVYGWADGVLVCFEIHGGRMSGWRQRPCAAAAARRYLDQSPPGWASFASRNAELAARLRSAHAELAARLRACPPGTCAG